MIRLNSKEGKGRRKKEKKRKKEKEREERERKRKKEKERERERKRKRKKEKGRTKVTTTCFIIEPTKFKQQAVCYTAAARSQPVSSTRTLGMGAPASLFPRRSIVNDNQRGVLQSPWGRKRGKRKLTVPREARLKWRSEKWIPG